MNTKIVQQIIKSRLKSFLCIAILVVANVGMYAYASIYQAPRLKALQDKWFEMRRQAGGGAAVDAATVYRQGTSDLAAWQARILPKKEFARFIGDLFETAGNNTLKMGTMTYKPAMVKGENLLTYTIHFDVSGKYAAVKSFISDIERLKEIAVIDSISLSSGKATEEAVDLKLELTAYFRVEG